MSEYKRLTNNNLEEYDPEYDFCIDCKYFGEPDGCNRPNGTCDNYERFIETYNRLSELEDKIENKNIIELPCKVGDTVYCIYHFDDVEEDFEYDIIPEEVVDIIVQEDDFDIGTACRMIGKFKRVCVCFTKAEAEKKLEELSKNR